MVNIRNPVVFSWRGIVEKATVNTHMISKVYNVNSGWKDPASKENRVLSSTLISRFLGKSEIDSDLELCHLHLPLLQW